jgi:hypothetical protein
MHSIPGAWKEQSFQPRWRCCWPLISLARASGTANAKGEEGGEENQNQRRGEGFEHEHYTQAALICETERVFKDCSIDKLDEDEERGLYASDIFSVGR